MPRGRPKKTTPSPGITINGQQVTWSFIMRVHNALGKSWIDTADAFWKARNCTGSTGIYRYINAGLKPGKNGIKYIVLPSRERENGKAESIMQWWKSLYVRKTAPDVAVADLLKSLIDKMGLPV